MRYAYVSRIDNTCDELNHFIPNPYDKIEMWCLNSFYIVLVYCVSRLGKCLYEKGIFYTVLLCPNDKESRYFYEYSYHADLFGNWSKNKGKISFNGKSFNVIIWNPFFLTDSYKLNVIQWCCNGGMIFLVYDEGRYLLFYFKWN